MVYSVAEAVGEVARSGPTAASEPDKCRTSLLSTVRVDLASEDSGMESCVDTVTVTVHESTQELIESSVVSGLELVL